LGRDFTWRIATRSGIFPIENNLRVTRLDNITEAALIGTITDMEILPPVTITDNVIFVGEYSTLMRGSNAETLAANLRSLLETGEYERRLAKVVGLKAIIDDPKNPKRQQLLDDIERLKTRGMEITIEEGRIRVQTTASWIISSARFGSEFAYGKPLLSLGDVDRYRWRSYLPTRDERVEITSEVGSLPPIDISTADIIHLNQAWRTLFEALRRTTRDGSIKVSLDATSYYIRKKIWEDLQKEVLETYPEMKPIYDEELLTLRATGEFRRLMYQHAATKQFERDQDYDLAAPGKFIIDYEEDGEFAKRLWLDEYVPGIMDVIEDITRYETTRKSKRTGTSTQRGEDIALKRLEKGPAEPKELVKLAEDAGVKTSLFNNRVLPILLKKGFICKPHYGLYKLKDCKTCSLRNNCTNSGRDTN
jgi:hypothetical protein